MTIRTNQQSRRPTLHVCLAIAMLSLVPHLSHSYDFYDGLRVGSDYATNAYSDRAILLGQNNTNPAPYSMAIGSSNSLGGNGPTGYGTIAVGSYNTLTGYTKFAFGSGNIVTGGTAMAIGSYNTVGGPQSVAYGTGNQTLYSASNALAGGSSTIAAGGNSVAFGQSTTAHSFASVVIGRYNAAVNNENNYYYAQNYWQAGDSLFVIGNGTSSNAPNNALLVTKDGMVTIKKVPAQGGVSMGAYYAE